MIGLPGYPLAAMVTFELFAAPLLGEVTGQPPRRELARARLDQPWNGHPDHEATGRAAAAALHLRRTARTLWRTRGPASTRPVSRATPSRM